MFNVTFCTISVHGDAPYHVPIEHQQRLCNKAWRMQWKWAMLKATFIAMHSNKRQQSKKSSLKKTQVWRDAVWVDPTEGRQLVSRALSTLRSLMNSYHIFWQKPSLTISCETKSQLDTLGMWWKPHWNGTRMRMGWLRTVASQTRRLTHGCGYFTLSNNWQIWSLLFKMSCNDI